MAPNSAPQLIVSLKKAQPSWGAPKIRERLKRRYPDVHTPAVSTVHAVLDRHDLVNRRRRRRYRAEGTALSKPRVPNDLWCADYKGEFMLADRRYCYPLTITDFESRYLFACEASLGADLRGAHRALPDASALQHMVEEGSARVGATSQLNVTGNPNAPTIGDALPLDGPQAVLHHELLLSTLGAREWAAPLTQRARGTRVG